MRTGEKIQVALLSAVIVFLVGVAVALGIATEETNPLNYLGFAIPVVVFGWWVRSTLRGARTRVRAREAGTRGKLKVLKASEVLGGVATVNDQPYLRLELEIEVPGRPPDRFTKHMVVPRLAIPAVMGGAPFDVAVDPKDPRRFDVEW